MESVSAFPEGTFMNDNKEKLEGKAYRKLTKAICKHPCIPVKISHVELIHQTEDTSRIKATLEIFSGPQQNSGHIEFTFQRNSTIDELRREIIELLYLGNI